MNLIYLDIFSVIESNFSALNSLPIGIKQWLVGLRPPALDLLDAGLKFDIALLDLEMPKLNGLDTARAIRARKTKAAHARVPLPLLALTAGTQSEEIDACLEAGMNGHLAKPFDQLDLEEKIAQLCPAARAA